MASLLKKTHVFLLCAISSGGIFVSCNRQAEYVELTGSVWNTVYNIKYKGDPGLADSITAIMRDVELSLSPFNPNSVISRINRNETDTVDNRVAYIFNLSKEINKVSHGAFDPTLSTLINLWGFGYEKKLDIEPAQADIEEALTKVGIAGCTLNEGTIRKKHPETTFNFSAVTKGYGCDEIAGMLRSNGVEDFMIEIGGEIALGGVNDRGKPWRIMVETPEEGLSRSKTGVKTFSLSNCGVATSGNYRNYHDTASGRVGHTIDARTGYPVKANVLSATVIAPTCARADALATACMAMAPDSALMMIEAADSTKCLLVVLNPADSVTYLQESPGFP